MIESVCVSPVDGSEYARMPCTSDTEISTLLEKAREAQKQWAELTVAQRAVFCGAAVDAMLAMKEDIVPELAWQMGRPVKFGAGELGGFEERARHMISIAESALAPVVPDPKEGFKRYIKREPLGLVFTVAPWNFPYLTAVNSIIPALMAGNAVFLKHAAQTLLVGQRFAQAFAAANLPEGLFTTLVLSHDQTNKLISSRSFDQIMFTGSVSAGKTIERAAAGTFAGVGLELGGKDPAYVRADADVAFAVENVVDGGFFNSGQSCCGIERVYVHEEVYSDFVEGAASLVSEYLLDSPLEKNTTLGPIVNPRAADFVRDQIDSAEKSGATACVDTSAFEREARGSCYLAPQVMTGVDHSMSVMKDESFGPVIGVMKVRNDEEAIALMNDSEFGLTASIWTKDLEAAQSIGDRIETGTVFMNRCDYLDPALAWTGVKDTGRGATLSVVGYEHLTRPKSFHLRK